MNILCLGDVVGKPGRDALLGCLEELKSEHSIDVTVVNAENTAAGAGITSKLAKELLEKGCDVLTLGDHVWDQKELEGFLNESERIIRPANFPEGVPGRGWTIYETKNGQKVGVVNLLGRVFMRHSVDCPFRKLDSIIEEIKKETSVIVVDMHAEATSEKVAIGRYVDGRASIVFGTHTHIPTADEKILNAGTAYITDLGMTGPYDSIIGQDTQAILKRFLTGMPFRFSVAKGDVRVCGVVVTVNDRTGRASSIQRINKSINS